MNKGKTHNQLIALAERGDVSAKIALAEGLVENGIEDVDEATKIVMWIQELAKTGNPDAQYYTATMYRLSKDHMSAFFFYGKAAMQNHPLSLYWAARYYFSGQAAGIDKDLNTAFCLAEKAFKLGEKKYSPQLLACFYLSGNVVNQDLKEAYKLMKMALSNGNDDVIDDIKQLENFLS